MTRNEQAVIAFILTHLPTLLYRDFLQELVTIPDRHHIELDTNLTGTIHLEADPYPGKLLVYNKRFYAVTEWDLIDSDKDLFKVKVEETGILDLEDDEPLVNTRTPFELNPGILENFKEGDPIVTCLGRVILNYIVLCEPFGDTFPFINGSWSPKVLEPMIAEAILNKKISNAQVNHYGENLSFIGHSPEFYAPNLTEKSLTTDPKITQKKRELLVEYGDALQNGDAVAMSHIEQTLIKMDKDYLKGDEAMNYLIKGKFFSVVRKKLFVIHGMVESFGTPGQYSFIPNSLEEGWTQESFPVIANEIRAGSYSRARETAKGGEVSKDILRVFMNTRITGEDCGTTRYREVDITDTNAYLYVYRNYLNGNKLDTVTKENYRMLAGKRVKFRSPMYCEQPDSGYCFKCMGKLFEVTHQTELATSVNNLGATFTTLALKSMHGVSVDTIQIKSLNDFVL